MWYLFLDEVSLILEFTIFVLKLGGRVRERTKESLVKGGERFKTRHRVSQLEPLIKGSEGLGTEGAFYSVIFRGRL